MSVLLPSSNRASDGRRPSQVLPLFLFCLLGGLVLQSVVDRRRAPKPVASATRRKITPSNAFNDDPQRRPSRDGHAFPLLGTN